RDGHVTGVQTCALPICNCSICKKRGALWAFAPGDKFALRAGDEALTDYQFGKKTIHHLFCAQCGVGAFSRGQTPDGKEVVAINEIGRASCRERVEITEV